MDYVAGSRDNWRDDIIINSFFFPATLGHKVPILTIKANSVCLSYVSVFLSPFAL